MANLFNRPSTGDIRGRLRERAMSTVTSGPMAQDDDYLSLYLPSNEIKADTTIDSSSSSQDAGATPVSTPSGQPNIQSPAGVVADDSDIQDMIDIGTQAKKAQDAGQRNNILSTLDPVRVDELENKARDLMGQDLQAQVKAESERATAELYDPAFIPNVRANSQKFDAAVPETETTTVAPAARQSYSDYKQGFMRIESPGVGGSTRSLWNASARVGQMLLASPAVAAKSAGAPDWLLDPMFSFLNDAQSIRASHVLGDLVRVNKRLDDQINSVSGYLEAKKNRDSYRSILQNEYDPNNLNEPMSPEKLDEIKRSLVNTEAYLNENSAAAAQAMKDLYMVAHEDRSTESDANPLGKYMGLTMARDARGVASGQRVDVKDVDGFLNHLAKAKEKNQTSADRRIAEYREEQKVLHWMNDIYRVSDEYTKKREDGEFKWTDPESWYYQVPGTMGSSFAEGQAMAAQFVASVGAHAVTKALPRVAATGGVSAPVQFGLGVLVGGVTGVTSYISRAQESGAEVYDAYRSKIYDYVGRDNEAVEAIVNAARDESGQIDPSKISDEDRQFILNSSDLGKILSEGKSQLMDKGVNLDGYTDDEIFNEMIIYGIRTSDPGFNEIVKTSIKGLDRLWQDNMALGVGDVAEAIIVVPYVGTAFKNVVKYAAPGATRAAAEMTEEVAKKASKALTATTHGVAKNMSKIGLKTTATGVEAFIKKGLEPAVRLGLSSLSEMGEEGSQFIGAYNYANDKFAENPNIFGAPFRAMASTAESWIGFLGLHSDPALNNDKELVQSMKLGAVVSLVQGGAVRNIPVGRRGDILEFADALAGSRIAQQMTAEQIAAKEEMANIATYTRKALSRPDSKDYYIKQLEEMKLTKPADAPIANADIDNEVNRAKRAFAMIESPLTESMRKAADINRYSEDFQTLIGLRIRAAEHLREATNSANANRAVYEAQFSSPEIREFLEAQGFSESEYGEATEIARLNSEIKFLEEFSDGMASFGEHVDEMNSLYGTGRAPVFEMSKENAANYSYEVANMLADRKAKKAAAIARYENRLEDLKSRGRDAYGMDFDQTLYIESGSAEESLTDAITRVENTIATLETLDMNGISYSAGVNMAGSIAADLNLKEAMYRNAIYNGPLNGRAKYGKKAIKNNIDEVKKDINTYNQVGAINDMINALSIDEQHNEILGQAESQQRPVVEDMDAPNESESRAIDRMLDKGRDAVSAIGSAVGKAKQAVTSKIDAAKARREQAKAPVIASVWKDPYGGEVFVHGDDDSGWTYTITTDPGVREAFGPYPTKRAALLEAEDTWDRVRSHKEAAEAAIEPAVGPEEAPATVTIPEEEKVAPEALKQATEAPIEPETEAVPEVEDLSGMMQGAEPISEPPAIPTPKEKVVRQREARKPQAKPKAEPTAALVVAPKIEPVTAPAVEEAPKAVPVPGYGENNKVVTKERYEELAKRMRDKLNQLSVGVDPEIMSMGMEMAAYHIESGVRKFASFANQMVSEFGPKIKPYLKSFYEGARFLPGMEPYTNDLDPQPLVASFNVESVTGVIEPTPMSDTIEIEDLSGMTQGPEVVAEAAPEAAEVITPDPVEEAEEEAQSPLERVMLLIDRAEDLFEKVDWNNLVGLKGGLEGLKALHKFIMEEYTKPEVHSNETVLDAIDDIELMMASMNESIANLETQPEVNPGEDYAGMPEGMVNTDPVQQDKGELPSTPEAVPSVDPVLSQTANTETIAGTQNTAEFQEAKEELSEEEDEANETFRLLTQMEQGAEVEEPVKAQPMSTQQKLDLTYMQAAEDLGDTAAQELLSTMNPAVGDPDRFGLLAGTVFFRPDMPASEMQDGSHVGYEHGREFAKILADPRGLDGADIFITVEPDRSRFARDYELKSPSTWNDADIRIHVHKDGKKYMGMLRTPKTMKQWHEKAGKDLNVDHLAALTRLRNSILETRAKYGPDARIVPKKVSRNSGSYNTNMRDGKRVFRPVQDVKGFGISPDVTKLEQNGEFFAIGKGVRGAFSVVKSEGDVIPGFKANSGVVLLFPSKNNTTSGKLLPHKLNSVRMSDDPQAVELIWEAITGFSIANPLASVREKHGLNIRGIDFINMVINFGDHTAISPEQAAIAPFLVAKQFYYDQNRRVFVVGGIDYTVDFLRTEAGKNQFMNQVSENFHFVAPLNEFWEPFSKDVRASMVMYNKQAVSLTKYVNFDMQDTGLTVDEDGRVAEGDDTPLNTLQWQVKNKLLLSDMSDQLYTGVFMYIDDVTAEIPKGKENTLAVAASEVSPIEDAAPSEEMPDSLRSLFEAAGFDLRVGDGGSVTMTERDMAKAKKINTKRAVKWLTKKMGLSEDQIVVTNGVLRTFANGAKVYGRATADAIAISTDAIEGTEYHEAWHRTSLLILTPAQREKLYEEARAEFPEYGLLPNNQLEEVLAEKFRDYMINNRGFKYTIQKLFSPIKTFINKLFNIAVQPKTALTQMYEQIARGDFKNYKLDAESLKAFEGEYAGGADFTVGPNNDYTPKNVLTVGDWYEAMRSLMSVAFLNNEVFTIGDIEKVNLASVKKTMEDMIKYRPGTSIASTLQEMLDQFDTVVTSEIVDEMLNIAVKMTEEASEENKEEGDAGEVGRASFSDKPAFYSSKRDTALPAAKFFIASQPATEFVTKEADGAKVRSVKPILSPVTGLPMFVDFSTSWNLMLNNMYHVESVEDMLAESARLGKHNPFFQALNNRIARAQKEGRENLLTQLLQTFQSHKHNMMTLTYGITESDDGKTAILSWTVEDSETERIAKATPRAWSSAFYNSDMVKITPEGATLNQEKIAEVQKAYTDLKDRINAEFVNDAEASAIVADLVNVLRSIGIHIDAPTLEAMAADPFKFPNIDRISALRAIMTRETAGSLSFLIRDLSTADQKQELTTKRGKVKLKGLSDIYEGASVNSFINQAAKNFAKVSPNMQEMMVIGPDGNLMYPIAQHNYMSNIVNEYNDPTSEEFAKLDSDIYAKNSVLKAAFKSKGAPVKLYTYTNFRSEVGMDKGRSYKDISPVEDYLSKMALTAAGHMILPTMADKGTYHTLKGVTMFDMPLSIEERDGTLYARTDDTVLKYMKAAFLDEFNTVTAYWKNKDKVDANSRLAVVNYHTKNLGGKFRHFDWVYKRVDGKEQWVSLSAEIDKRKGNPEATLKFLDEVKAYMIDDAANAAGVLNSLLRQAVSNELSTLEKLGVIRLEVDKNTGATLYKNNVSMGAVQGLDQMRLDAMAKSFMGLSPAVAEHYAIQSMVSNYTYNTIMSIIETQKVFTGDPAFFKNNDDMIKRLPAVLSTGDNLRTDWPQGHRLNGRTMYSVAEFNDNEIASAQHEQLQALTKAAYMHKNPNATDLEAELFARNSTNKYGLNSKGKGQMNQTDASVFISPQMYKDITEMLGEWSPEVEAAFKLLESEDTSWLGDPIKYQQALDVTLKPLKMMHFGFRSSELGVRIPVFDKMALFPMFKIFATGDMQAMYERMTGTNQYEGAAPLDMIKFTSAVKSGSQSAMDPYTDSSNSEVSNLDNLGVYGQRFRDLRRQLVTDPHHEERQMLGTQAAKAVLANLRLDDTYGDGVTHPKMEGKLVRDNIYTAMNTLSNQGRERVEDMFMSGEGAAFDKKLFSDKLIAMAKASGMNPEFIDGLQIVNGDFKIPLAASSDTKWIASSLNSLINDETVSINLPGGAFIQMSSFATNTIATYSDSEVRREAYNQGERLKIHNTEGAAKGSMDAIVSINLLKHILPNSGKGMSFEMQVAWLRGHGIIGNGENVGPIAIGYRIPTQGMSSISSLRIVDVLPANIGDTIVLPDEFTTLTGSDYDVDKLYVARYNYNKYGEKIEYDYTKSSSEQSRAANENMLLDMYQLIMTDDNNVDETKAPLDNTTDVVKNEILPIIDSGLPKGRNFPFKYASPTYQLNKKSEYTGGKNGISPFALNSVHHPITQSVGLSFKPNSLLDQFGFGRLDKVWDDTVVDVERDAKGYAVGKTGIKDAPLRVLDHLSAMINAHVDVAKDPYVIRLGINQWTYNMANFLLRSGAGKRGYYFLAQPILKDMSLAYAQLQGKYGVDQRKSKSALEREELTKVADRYRKAAREAIDAMPNKVKAEELSLKLNSLSTKNIGEGYYANNSTMNKAWLIDNLHDQLKPTAEYYLRQLEVYDTYLKLSPYAREMSDLVQLSQIDTKKFGNNFALHRQFMYRLKNFILHSKFFDSQDLANYFKNTFLDTKIRNSMEFGRELFDGQFLNTTREFEKAFDSFLTGMGEYKRGTKDENLIKLISNELEASIKGRFFDFHMEAEGLDAADMFYGENSMARRMDALKSKILLGTYPEMITADGRIKNDLLNHLGTEYRGLNEIYAAPDMIVLPAVKGNDKLLDRKLIKYWEELYTSPHEEIAKFARDLVSYAFLTSGDNFNKNSFFNIVPNSIRSSIGYTPASEEGATAKRLDYATYMRYATDDLRAGVHGIDTDNVYLNSWYNNELVPWVESIATPKDEHRPVMKRLWAEGTKKAGGKAYPVVMVLPTARPIGNNKDGALVYPRYVKQALANDNNPETTMLYKYAGYYVNARTGKAEPVYFAVHKKGMNMNGKVIKEYDGFAKSGLPFNNLPYVTEGNFNDLFEKDENGVYYNINGLEIRGKETNDIGATWRKMLEGYTGQDGHFVPGMKFVEDTEVADHLRDRSYDSVINQERSTLDAVPSNEAVASNPGEVVFNSGGAEQSESEFHLAAMAYGIGDMRAWGEPGSTEVSSEGLYDAGVTPTAISQQDYTEGLEKMNEATTLLNRQPSKQKVISKLASDWAQVKYSDAIFAVGYTEPGKDHIVMGGTGWAVAYAQNERKPIYLFDQGRNMWTVYDYNLMKFMPYEGTPKLTKAFAGIGTSSRLTAEGKAAIWGLYENTFGKTAAEKVATEEQAEPTASTAEQTADVVNRFRNDLNAMFEERADMNRQEVEAEFDEIVKAHEGKSADSLNEALLRFLCRQ